MLVYNGKYIYSFLQFKAFIYGYDTFCSENYFKNGGFCYRRRLYKIYSGFIYILKCPNSFPNHQLYTLKKLKIWHKTNFNLQSLKYHSSSMKGCMYLTLWQYFSFSYLPLRIFLVYLPDIGNISRLVTWHWKYFSFSYLLL